MAALLMTWHCLVSDFSGLSCPASSNKTSSLLQFYVPPIFVISKIIMQLKHNVTPNTL